MFEKHILQKIHKSLLECRDDFPSFKEKVSLLGYYCHHSVNALLGFTKRLREIIEKTKDRNDKDNLKEIEAGLGNITPYLLGIFQESKLFLRYNNPQKISGYLEKINSYLKEILKWEHFENKILKSEIKSFKKHIEVSYLRGIKQYKEEIKDIYEAIIFLKNVNYELKKT